MKFDFYQKVIRHTIFIKLQLLLKLPYIREHAGQVFVIKYGGHAMGDLKLSKSFSKDISLMKEIGILPVIIHGGGPQIGKMLKKILILNLLKV